jgi:hypothetical protein
MLGTSFTDVALTKRPYTISDLINVFSAAGPWIESAVGLNYLRRGMNSS